MKLYCKRCNCVYDSNDVPEYVCDYGESLNICPQCRNLMEIFGEDFYYDEDDEDEWGDDC